jgi:altronate dehydratase small subunit
MKSDQISPGKRATRLDVADNVATLLEDVDCGPVKIYGPEQCQEIQAVESIKHGHKMAVTEVLCGAPIVKYGVPIGISTSSIKPGEWVHLHNCRSLVDQRSNSLDLNTGAANDTPYA